MESLSRPVFPGKENLPFLKPPAVSLLAAAPTKMKNKRCRARTPLEDITNLVTLDPFLRSDDSFTSSGEWLRPGRPVPPQGLRKRRPGSFPAPSTPRAGSASSLRKGFR